MEELIKNFVIGNDSGDGSGVGAGAGSDESIGFGDGYGYGSGYGYESGAGSGSGVGPDDGDGYDSDEGSSKGSGKGSGTGEGDVNISYGLGYGNETTYGDVKVFNGQPVYIIDGLPMIITAIHNNIASGYILKGDLTLEYCYIAKVDGYFAHGYSARQALLEAQSKYKRRKPIEERIAEFNSTFPDREKKIPARELFEWHNILTGSCLFGRHEFCIDHKIDIDTDSFTVNEFIALTKNDYGGEVIKQL